MKNLTENEIELLSTDLTENQKYQIDNILSGNTYYRNTGNKWSKQNLLDEVAELFADEYIVADKWEEFLIKKQYTKEQLATMYITKKPFEKVVIRKTSLTQKKYIYILNRYIGGTPMDSYTIGAYTNLFDAEMAFYKEMKKYGYENDDRVNLTPDINCEGVDYDKEWFIDDKDTGFWGGCRIQEIHINKSYS
jgi:hypothetical protein